MTDERIIEVTVTAADVSEMRASGVPESEIPAVGTVERYRPARHIIRDQVAVILDRDIADHLKKNAVSNDREYYQKEVNQTLRRALKLD